jgi:sarcosine oxidase gamma subunit
MDDAAKLLFLARAQAFQKSMLELIEKETAAWVAEFQSSLADLDKVVQAQRQAADANLQAALKQEEEIRDRVKKDEEAKAADLRPGAVNIEIDGDIEGVMEVLLDGGRVKETSARTTALMNLSKGQHAIEVRGVKAGKPISASKVLTIEAGTIAELKLTPH